MPSKRTRTGSPKHIATGEKVAKTDASALRGPEAGEHKVTFSFHYADHGYRGNWSWPAADEAHENRPTAPGRDLRRRDLPVPGGQPETPVGLRRRRSLLPPVVGLRASRLPGRA
jgi:hypothetical protein